MVRSRPLALIALLALAQATPAIASTALASQATPAIASTALASQATPAIASTALASQATTASTTSTSPSVIASGRSGVRPETRVRGFRLGSGARVDGDRDAGRERAWGIGAALAGTASGCLLAARGGTGAIGATGKVGEQALKGLGGESQVFLRTSQGGRYVDQLVNGIAHESKVGYTALTTKITTQIAKDAELIGSGQIRGSVWHFFQSPTTGLGGPSGPLGEALKQAGIGIVIH